MTWPSIIVSQALTLAALGWRRVAVAFGVVGVALRCPKCMTPSVLSADEVGAEGRLTCCESCGTSWLARHFHEEKLRQALKALPRQPLIIEGELAPRRLSAVAARGFGERVEHDAAERGMNAPRRSTERRPQSRPAARPADVRRATAKARPTDLAEMVPGGLVPRQVGRPGWRAGRRRLGPVLFAVAVTIVAAFAAPTVTALPGVGALLHGEALALTDVKSTFLANRGEPTIVVEGELWNKSGRATAVPAIRVSLRNTAGEEVSSWSVEPSVAELDAGASIGFRSALTPPVAGGDHVALSLVERYAPIIGTP